MWNSINGELQMRKQRQTVTIVANRMTLWRFCPTIFFLFFPLCSVTHTLAHMYFNLKTCIARRKSSEIQFCFRNKKKGNSNFSFSLLSGEILIKRFVRILCLLNCFMNEWQVEYLSGCKMRARKYGFCVFPLIPIYASIVVKMYPFIWWTFVSNMHFSLISKQRANNRQQQNEAKHEKTKKKKEILSFFVSMLALCWLE